MTSRIVTIAIYGVLFASLGVLQLLASYRPRSVPTLAQALRWTMRRRSAQIGIVMAWWWIGWHFLVS